MTALMLERPSLDDETIVAFLREGYGLPIERLEFVPLGNDSAAWTYHATTPNAATLFVKVRREPRPAGILIPRFLRDLGLTEVVAAHRTRDGEPWLEIGPWSVLVYPFVDAPNAMRAGLGVDGWRRLGAFAARLHATTLPADLAALVPREDFRPRANELASRVARQVDAYPVGAASHDELAERLVEAWTAHLAEIEWLVRRSEALAQRIRDRAANAPLPSMLCHADLHVGNVLVSPDGSISVVDWDEVTLAPPERDLMFVRGSAIAGRVSDREATAFESGYGSSEANPLLIAWYRVDWAIQDLADFARRVILDPELGAATRAAALALFDSTFEPGGEVETAVIADELVPAED
jgi:spectinomycin phosphotransferase